MIQEAIKKLVDKRDLTYGEAYHVMSEILDGKTTGAHNAAFLAALSTKGTRHGTIDEIAGCAAAMRVHATPLPGENEDVLEMAGTGGDDSGSFDIFLASAFVCAAGGARVVVHGNRAAAPASQCAECLKALGINARLDPERSAEMLRETGLCFLFADEYYPSMKHVACNRQDLGIRSAFNVLDALASPAKPRYGVLGVYDPSLVEPLAMVLIRLGVERGLVVHGKDRLDEMSICGPTTVCEFGDGKHRSYEVTPEQYGLRRWKRVDLAGGDAEENANIIRAILDGTDQGARRGAVLLNAGGALYVAGRAETLVDGVRLAGRLIDTGKALGALKTARQASKAPRSAK